MHRSLLALALAGILSVAPRIADALVITLGDQDFADGANVLLAPYNAASVGEPAPFGGFIGDDKDTDFSASWSFAFPAGAYVGATLRFGVYDHDSSDSGSQVTLFSFDANDLTALIDGLFEADAGHNGDVFVYEISIPALLIAQLADGLANFTLTLEGVTSSTIGIPLPNNGAGLDFAELILDDGIAVPTPASAVLLASGIAGLLAGRRRRS